MPERSYLGEMELMVLLAVVRLGDDAYGVPISKELLNLAGREVALGSVYAALDRLQEKGFVTSALGDPTPERGGRAKRYFRVTPAGLRALRMTRTALTNLWSGIPLLEGKEAGSHRYCRRCSGRDPAALAAFQLRDRWNGNACVSLENRRRRTSGLTLVCAAVAVVAACFRVEPPRSTCLGSVACPGGCARDQRIVSLGRPASDGDDQPGANHPWPLSAWSARCFPMVAPSCAGKSVPFYDPYTPAALLGATILFQLPRLGVAGLPVASTR